MTLEKFLTVSFRDDLYALKNIQEMKMLAKFHKLWTIEILELKLDQVKDLAEEMEMDFPTLAELMGERRCRECGCTDIDCSMCIEKTGQPCDWVEDDLCSACAPDSVDMRGMRDIGYPVSPESL